MRLSLWPEALLHVKILERFGFCPNLDGTWKTCGKCGKSDEFTGVLPTVVNSRFAFFCLVIFWQAENLSGDFCWFENLLMIM